MLALRTKESTAVNLRHEYCTTTSWERCKVKSVQKLRTRTYPHWAHSAPSIESGFLLERSPDMCQATDHCSRTGSLRSRSLPRMGA